MAWIYLAVAGVLEIVWAIGLKYTEGFTRPLASTVTVVAMAASMWCLALALKEIPIGTGYAVWVGIGAVGTAIPGHRAVRRIGGLAAPGLRGPDPGRHHRPQTHLALSPVPH